MILLAAAAALAAATPVPVDFVEIGRAIESHRLVQARRMLGEAVARGASGPQMEQLLADLAYADGLWSEAQARYSRLAAADPKNIRSAERAGLSSIMARDTTRARSYLKQAITSGHASWEAWNGFGIVCDLERDWDGADAAFATADELSPDNAEVLNNHGWSLLLRGEWESAVVPLQRAAELDPKSTRIANNLELARAALAGGLPKRRTGETSASFAARLNDAGIAAQSRGDTSRAIAAFSQALTVSEDWYARAANNLARLQGK
ncbi:MAG TPA: hypothetical protein VFP53_04795 [Sphingomicrobium sp.]|nr:hypothetical protein [Sphingomicrobium sp.]